MSYIWTRTTLRNALNALCVHTPTRVQQCVGILQIVVDKEAAWANSLTPDVLFKNILGYHMAYDSNEMGRPPRGYSYISHSLVGDLPNSTLCKLQQMCVLVSETENLIKEDLQQLLLLNQITNVEHVDGDGGDPEQSCYFRFRIWRDTHQV